VSEPPPDNAGHPIFRLVEIMARLRAADGGCAWDREQTFATVAPYTIEEAYEVADAIERGDLHDLRDELGDLLLQVVFHAQMAQEVAAFDFADVARAINDKMIRRHPHVFGDGQTRSPREQTLAWEAAKQVERAARISPTGTSLLDGVPAALPALTRAEKLSRRAAAAGFAWPSVGEVLEKLHEEIAELEAEVRSGDPARVREELGDVLFVLANIALTLDIDPEDALRAANAKFVRRFTFIERRLAEAGATPAQSDLAEMDGLWNEAKAAEKSSD
jgi:MazG family protein